MSTHWASISSHKLYNLNKKYYRWCCLFIHSSLLACLLLCFSILFFVVLLSGVLLSFLGFLLLLLLALLLCFCLFLLFLCGNLLLSISLIKFFESVHGNLGSGGHSSAELVCTSSKHNFASITLPNANSLSSYRSLNIGMNTFPQWGQTYFACCWSSNFFIIFLRAPPYLVPYLPTMPTFLVLLVISSDGEYCN